MRVAVYSRVSTHDQQTLGMQVVVMADDIKVRCWQVVQSVEDVGSGVKERRGSEQFLKAARRLGIGRTSVRRILAAG